MVKHPGMLSSAELFPTLGPKGQEEGAGTGMRQGCRIGAVAEQGEGGGGPANRDGPYPASLSPHLLCTGE